MKDFTMYVCPRGRVSVSNLEVNLLVLHITCPLYPVPWSETMSQHWHLPVKIHHV